jgi:outer membrane lipoprotein
MSARSTAVAALALALLAGCATVSKPLQGEFAAITPHQAIEQDSTGTAVR